MCAQIQRVCKRRTGRRRLVSAMEDLPLDTTLNILARVPINTLFHCRRVCKEWHSLTQDPSLPYLHQACRESQNNICLVFHAFSGTCPQEYLYFIDGCDQLNDDDENDGVYKEEKEEVLKRINMPFKYYGFKFVLECNGLLCLSYIEVPNSLNDYICIYNPFTEEVTNLPAKKAIFRRGEKYCFGFHPVTKEYKVIKLVERECYEHNFSWSHVDGIAALSLEQSMEVFTLGTDEWKCKGVIPFLIEMDQVYYQALVNGALHWFGQCKRSNERIIVAFDLKDEEFCQIPRPPCSLFQGRVLVLGGRLSLVVHPMHGWDFDVWLMKEYGLKESWTKEFTIRQNGLDCKDIQPLCLLRNGKILIQCSKSELLSYDPNTMSYKSVTQLSMFPKV